MNDIVLNTAPLTAPWTGQDPFLVCAHHVDHYPASDGAMGVPAAQVGTRQLGNDFSGAGGFNMYFGHRVPGFLMHPHRGFETITFVRRGYVDHSDTLGATARYGPGDVQWLTAGRGIQHAEMFPLLDHAPDNTFELFQIWFNLPAVDKFAAPDFKIFWRHEVPVWRQVDATQPEAINELTVIAGTFRPEAQVALVPPRPPEHSWAAREDTEVAIWVLRLSPGQHMTLPPAVSAHAHRTLYVFAGDALRVGGQVQPARSQIEVRATLPCVIDNDGDSLLEIMVMQGCPIGEPVAARGPYVMNTEAELHQARLDYTQTRFGGWPWSEPGPVHPVDAGRFARYPGTEAIDRPTADSNEA